MAKDITISNVRQYIWQNRYPPEPFSVTTREHHSNGATQRRNNGATHRNSVNGARLLRAKRGRGEEFKHKWIRRQTRSDENQESPWLEKLPCLSTITLPLRSSATPPLQRQCDTSRHALIIIYQAFLIFPILVLYLYILRHVSTYAYLQRLDNARGGRHHFQRYHLSEKK